MKRRRSRRWIHHRRAASCRKHTPEHLKPHEVKMPEKDQQKQEPKQATPEREVPQKIGARHGAAMIRSGYKELTQSLVAFPPTGGIQPVEEPGLMGNPLPSDLAKNNEAQPRPEPETKAALAKDGKAQGVEAKEAAHGLPPEAKVDPLDKARSGSKSQSQGKEKSKGMEIG